MNQGGYKSKNGSTDSNLMEVVNSRHLVHAVRGYAKIYGNKHLMTHPSDKPEASTTLNANAQWLGQNSLKTIPELEMPMLNS